MSRNPTWFSIKNRLEAGLVKTNNEWERFITSLVTSYGCLDIWYKNISSESNVLECRIFYLQVDSTYTATESWHRTGERPKPWMQLKGTVRELRATLISLLPQLSQLHDTKRHGEWILGATQPFEGQGSIVTRVASGSGFVTVITGRFGDLLLNGNGVELNWENITWSFDGCNPTATGPDSDQVCILRPGSSIPDCISINPVGTCLTGSCGNWSATYPTTNADCAGTWFAGVDYSGLTQKQWNTNQSCVAPTGTCVTGNCVSGFTTGTTTEAACLASGGTWYSTPKVQTNQQWIDQLGCLGCCVVGENCEYPFVRAGMTEAACTTIAAGRPHTWTQNQTAWGGCTYEEAKSGDNCGGAPNTITVTVQLNYTRGSHLTPNGCNNPAGCFGWGNRIYGGFWWGADITWPAVTPGSASTPPALFNEGTDCTTHPNYDSAAECILTTKPDTSSFYHSLVNCPGWDMTNQVGHGNLTMTYVFNKDVNQTCGDTNNDICHYSLAGTTAQYPVSRAVPTQRTMTSACCSFCYGPVFTFPAMLDMTDWKIESAVHNLPAAGSLTRTQASSGAHVYDGGITALDSTGASRTLLMPFGWNSTANPGPNNVSNSGAVGGFPNNPNCTSNNGNPNPPSTTSWIGMIIDGAELPDGNQATQTTTYGHSLVEIPPPSEESGGRAWTSYEIDAVSITTTVTES